MEIGRGPMLAVTEPGVRTITCMVATQLLKTSLLMNTAGYFAHLDPCPMLLVQPKEAAAEAFSKERVEPMIKETPVLRGIVGSSKTRSKDETLLFKAFPGGFLALVGAGSPDNLARRPVRVVMYDEVDKYIVTKEGDPLDLGDERLASFDLNSLSVRVCSPTEKGGSRIEKSEAASDQRRATVECPHCAHRQFLDFFKHVQWPKSEDGEHQTHLAAIHCEACGVEWSEGQRLKALRTIRWHQTRPFTCCGERQDPLEAYERAWRAEQGGVDAIWSWWTSPRHAVYRAKCSSCGTWPVANDHAGFQASKLFSPSQRDKPSEIAKKWIAAQDDEDKLQPFFNTQLALTYRRNTSKEVRSDALAARAQVYSAAVPDGVAIITVGLDTQDYRVEATAFGFGRNEESWTLEHEVFDGDPETDPTLELRIDAWLKKIRYRADGRPFEVAAACWDSAGHHTDWVYRVCKARLGRKIWAIKGESAKNGQRNPIWPVKRPTSRTKKSFRPIIIGVNAAKDVIYARLMRTSRSEPGAGGGAGLMHFPADLDLNHYAQLTAERLVTKEASGGQKYRVWEQIPGRANEAFDCAVYAYAALCGLIHMGLKLNRRADEVGCPAGLLVSDEPAPVEAGAAAADVASATAPPPATTTSDRRARAARLAARLSRVK